MTAPRDVGHRSKAPQLVRSEEPIGQDMKRWMTNVMAIVAIIGGTSVTLAMPDFSALSGWNNSWAPPTSSTVDWNAAALGFSGQACAENARSIVATRTGTI